MPPPGRRTNVHVELTGVPDLTRVLGTVEHEVFPTAHSRSLNLVGRKMRTTMVRSIAKEMGVKQKSVRSRTKLTKASKIKPRVLLEFRGKAFNLIQFGARQTKKGVTAKPWGKRRRIDHAFIATMPNGSRIVVIRRLRGGRRVGRLPLDAWLGPGIAKTAAAEQLQVERDRLVQDVYPPELARQLALLVQQKLKRRARRAR